MNKKEFQNSVKEKLAKKVHSSLTDLNEAGSKPPDQQTIKSISDSCDQIKRNLKKCQDVSKNKKKSTTQESALMDLDFSMDTALRLSYIAIDGNG